MLLLLVLSSVVVLVLFLKIGLVAMGFLSALVHRNYSYVIFTFFSYSGHTRMTVQD